MKPTALGVHIYSGAFTLGVAREFYILGQWEEGPWGAATFDLNFPDIPHPLKLEDWPVATHVGAVDFIYANPPCAPWSCAGGLLGMADPRLSCTRNVMDLALKLKPQALIVESVPRAWSPSGGQDFYTELAEDFQRAGYAVTVYLTNALLTGASQWRERFHFIAHKHELDIPEPTMTIKDVPTVRDIIGDLEHSARWTGQKPTLPNHLVKQPSHFDLNTFQNLLPGEACNDGVTRAWAAGLEAKRWRNIAHRIRYDCPSSTMADIGSVVHPTVDRIITLREGARLCGYPDDFVFALLERQTCTHDARSADVTQAVLPPVGEYLAKLMLHSFDNRAAESGAFRVVDHRKIARPWSPGRYERTLEGIVN